MRTKKTTQKAETGRTNNKEKNIWKKDSQASAGKKDQNKEPVNRGVEQVASIKNSK